MIGGLWELTLFIPAEKSDAGTKLLKEWNDWIDNN